MTKRRAFSFRHPKLTYRRRPKALVKNVPETRRPEDIVDADLLYDLLDFLADEENIALAA